MAAVLRDIGSGAARRGGVDIRLGGIPPIDVLPIRSAKPVSAVVPVHTGAPEVPVIIGLLGHADDHVIAFGDLLRLDLPAGFVLRRGCTPVRPRCILGRGRVMGGRAGVRLVRRGGRGVVRNPRDGEELPWILVARINFRVGALVDIASGNVNAEIAVKGSHKPASALPRSGDKTPFFWRVTVVDAPRPHVLLILDFSRLDVKAPAGTHVHDFIRVIAQPEEVPDLVGVGLVGLCRDAHVVPLPLAVLSGRLHGPEAAAAVADAPVEVLAEMDGLFTALRARLLVFQIDEPVGSARVAVGPGVALIDADGVGPPVGGASFVIGEAAIACGGDVTHMAPRVAGCRFPDGDGVFPCLCPHFVSGGPCGVQPGPGIAPAYARENKAVVICLLPGVVSAGDCGIVPPVVGKRLPVGVGVFSGVSRHRQAGEQSENHAQGQER